jgi:hypothetical protein
MPIEPLVSNKESSLDIHRTSHLLKDHIKKDVLKVIFFQYELYLHRILLAKNMRAQN